MKTIKTVFYARVSTEDQEQIDALNDQINELRNFINDQVDWKLVDEYIDEGRTGTTTKNRKEYNRLVKDLETDKYDLIVIKDETRLNRNVLEWYKFIDSMLKNEKQLYFYIDRKFYTPEDGFLIGIKALMAEQYSKDLSVKINNAHKQRQLKGKVCTNSTIYGYDLIEGNLVINEDEAKNIRLIYKLYIEGNGFTKIRDMLFELGIKNANGNPFNTTSLKRIVSNEKYKGTLVSNKRHKDFETKKIYKVSKDQWIVHEDALPNIVTKEEWERANSILDERRQVYLDSNNNLKTTGYKQNSFVYSSKIICGECGKKYWHDARKNCKSDVWRCGTNRKNALVNGVKCSNDLKLTDEMLDQIMKSVISDFFKNREDRINKIIETLKKSLMENDNQEEIKSLEIKKNKLETKTSNIIDMLAENLITKDEYIAKKSEYDKELEITKNRFYNLKERLTSVMNKINRMESIKNSFNLENKNNPLFHENFIKNFLEKIIVHSNEDIDIYLLEGVCYSASIEGDNFNVGLVDNSSYKRILITSFYISLTFFIHNFINKEYKINVYITI